MWWFDLYWGGFATKKIGYYWLGLSPGLVLESGGRWGAADLGVCSWEVQMGKIGVTIKIRNSCMNNSV